MSSDTQKKKPKSLLAIVLVAVLALVGKFFGIDIPIGGTSDDKAGGAVAEAPRSAAPATTPRVLEQAPPKDEAPAAPKKKSPPADTKQKDPVRDDADKVAEGFKYIKSDFIVEVPGKVVHILPDDNEGSRHQRFILELSNEQTVLVAHNIDLAPYVPLEKYDEVTVKGEYEYNEKGGVVHWTHHDPKGWHEGGWIRHAGKTYE